MPVFLLCDTKWRRPERGLPDEAEIGSVFMQDSA